MSQPDTVTDPADPRLADYTGLTDVELRRRREPAEGLFIAEGEKVIRRPWRPATRCGRCCSPPSG